MFMSHNQGGSQNFQIRIFREIHVRKHKEKVRKESKEGEHWKERGERTAAQEGEGKSRGLLASAHPVQPQVELKE